MKLHDLYAAQMTNHPYGYALYKPTSKKVLRPGAVGYWNELGEWQHIAWLDDPASLEKLNLKVPEEDLERAKDDPVTNWRTMPSTKVKETDITASVKASGESAGVPISGKAFFEYQSSTDFGAVLIASKPVHRDGYYFESPFKRWVQDNVDVLRNCRRGADIEEHGLTIITYTYSTIKCTLNAWQDKSKKISLGLSASATDGLGVETEAGWFVGTSSSGWKDYSGKEKDEEVVVFASGFRFKVWQIFNKVIHIHSENMPSRGSDLAGEESADRISKEINMEIPSAVHEDGGFKVSFATFGQSPPEPPVLEDSESEIE